MTKFEEFRQSAGTTREDVARAGGMQINLKECRIMMSVQEFRGSAGTTWEDGGRAGGMQNDVENVERC